MTEPEVVEQVRAFLRHETLPGERPLLRLYTDAHHTLIDHGGLDPYQRVTLDLGDRAIHPDLVGQLSDGESALAIEAKGVGSLLKGATQAELYQNGFQYSFLAAPAPRVGESISGLAQMKNIGFRAVSTGVEPVFWPQARQPWRDAYRSVRRQLDTGLGGSTAKDYGPGGDVWALRTGSD